MHEQKRIGIGGVILIAIAVFWLIGRNGGGDDGSGKPAWGPSPPTATRPGSPAVYRRIDRLTNCSALQREFNIAADNADRTHDAVGTAPIPLAYMDAADSRMSELGCYG